MPIHDKKRPDKSFTREGILVYGSSTAWLLAERGLRILVAMTVGIYLARYLGPTHYGRLSYAIGLFGIFLPIANLCMDPLLIRELVRHPDNRDKILGTAFILRISSAFLTFLFYACIALQLPLPLESRLMILMIGSGLLCTPFQIIDDHFQSQLKVKFSVLAQISACLAVALLNFTGIVKHLPLIYFALAESANWLVMAFGWFLTFLARGGGLFAWRFDSATGKRLMLQAMPLVLIGVFYMLYTRTDHLLIQSLLGAQELGWYVVPVRLTETCVFIPQIIANALFPAIVVAAATSPEIYLTRLNQLYSLLIWSSLILAALLALIVRTLILRLYGFHFYPSIQVFHIYIWGLIPFAIQTVFMRWCLIENHFITAISAHGLAWLINLTSNLFFLKSYGLKAAALAFVFALPLGMLIALMWSRQGRKHLSTILYAIFGFKARAY
jgi:PST family polysaccharide transporter